MPQTGADCEVRRCIYHVPYPLDPNTTFGGQKRAVAMFKALTPVSYTHLTLPTKA